MEISNYFIIDNLTQNSAQIMESHFPNAVVFIKGYSKFGDLLSGSAFDENEKFIASRQELRRRNSRLQFL